MKCEKCNREFKNSQGLNYHLSINHREVNKDCYQFYIEKYKTESNFPWKIKKPVFKICECCSKEFKREFSLQMHLMSGKKNNTLCYQFYINKYKTEDDFPTRRYSASKLQNYQVCECCSKKYKQVLQHITTYSLDCYQFYISKYGSINNFPNDIKKVKTGICPDCGKITSSSDSSWCIDCYRKNHHTLSPNVIDRMQKQLKIIHSASEWKKKASKIQKDIFLKNPERAENQRKYMLTGGAIKALYGNKNCSKPQIEFFNLVKEFWCDAVLNHPLKELNVLLDIAIPSLKIDFEYDGSYWHQDQKHDDERDEKIRNSGWRIYRYRDRIPDKEEIQKIFTENQGKI